MIYNYKTFDIYYLDKYYCYHQNLNFLRPFATLFFAYSCQSGIFPVFANVKNFTINKVKIISKYAIGICIIIYLLLAILGYMTQPINPPSLIIERKSILVNKPNIAIPPNIHAVTTNTDAICAAGYTK